MAVAPARDSCQAIDLQKHWWFQFIATANTTTANITTSLMMLFWKPWYLTYYYYVNLRLPISSKYFPSKQYKSQDLLWVSCELSLDRSHLKIECTSLMKVELLEASNNESSTVSRVCGHLFSPWGRVKNQDISSARIYQVHFVDCISFKGGTWGLPVSIQTRIWKLCLM